jgi:hypothetical protein
MVERANSGTYISSDFWASISAKGTEAESIWIIPFLILLSTLCLILFV